MSQSFERAKWSPWGGRESVHGVDGQLHTFRASFFFLGKQELSSVLAWKKIQWVLNNFHTSSQIPERNEKLPSICTLSHF